MANLLKQLKQLEKKVDKELDKQVYICNGATTLYLWSLGWREKRIQRVMKAVDKVYRECGEWGPRKSMLEMLEEETGLEMVLDGNKTYHDIDFLSASAWDGKAPTIPKQIYVMEQQLQWLPTMVLACMCIALHRTYGWGANGRLQRYIMAMNEYRMQCRDPEWYQQQLREVCDSEIQIAG